MVFNGQGLAETFSRPSFPIKCIFYPTWTLKQPQILFMFKVKYVDSIMMLVILDLNLIVSLFQHKCEVSETVSTTTLPFTYKSQVLTTVPPTLVQRVWLSIQILKWLKQGLNQGPIQVTSAVASKERKK